ncbi:N-acetylglucosamine 6-phosphate deacetylase [Propionicimonas paludicola]|uniref:N-acetylglucosamine 6-phosphate deacetylase n=1 Tax=Propionicimonas paludicola TaxID=185243 RepID=A0A2A9CPT4_9ACTN|nr:amidohydrolase family protein [Propionicimonas paludicola]PFG15549.1 N-acetylglucosamine 6-phosphate deacetylase [Propionicimonas paludicola]
MRLLAGDRILFPDADAPAAGWIEVDGERIVATGLGTAPRPADEQLVGLVVPGYVDVHCHGGGGASFVTTDPEQVRTVLAAHRRHGVTTMVASLVTGRPEDLLAQVRCLAGLYRSGEIAGIHLEGPWLAPEFHGAHPTPLLSEPLPAQVGELVDAGAGAVKMVTIAPERDGALDSIALLAGRGVVAALGHTNAGYDQARAAIAAGATGSTHLFNAMAPLRHREPGPILALLEDPRVWLELIADGVHLRPELVAFIASIAPGRVVFVTDAMAAAAGPDGDYLLGELPVEVRDGLALVAGTDTIAGSTLTLDRAVQIAVAAGVPLAVAVRAATQHPADYLSLSEVGRLAPDMRADLVVLDNDLAVSRVLAGGSWLAR